MSAPSTASYSIEYGPYLLFKGYVVNPVWNAGARTVQINAHDATLKLKHHYHRYGDEPVDTGYPDDGVGFRMLLASSQPGPEQLARGVIGNGIVDGHDDVPEQGPKPDKDDADDPGAPLWGKANRGKNVWESLDRHSPRSAVGFDFDFNPIDQAHPADLGPARRRASLADLHTHPNVGDDRTDTVQFHYGFGADNAEDFTYEPDGGVVRNYWVEVNPDGERHQADDRNKALVHDEASWLQYGIYQGWESAGQKWPKAGARRTRPLLGQALRLLTGLLQRRPQTRRRRRPPPAHRLPGRGHHPRRRPGRDARRRADRPGDRGASDPALPGRRRQRHPDLRPGHRDRPRRRRDRLMPLTRPPDFLHQHLRTGQRVRDLEITPRTTHVESFIMDPVTVRAWPPAIAVFTSSEIFGVALYHTSPGAVTVQFKAGPPGSPVVVHAFTSAASRRRAQRARRRHDLRARVRARTRPVFYPQITAGIGRGDHGRVHDRLNGGLGPRLLHRPHPGAVRPRPRQPGTISRQAFTDEYFSTKARPTPARSRCSRSSAPARPSHSPETELRYLAT